jgi:hypothetical protein
MTNSCGIRARLEVRHGRKVMQRFKGYQINGYPVAVALTTIERVCMIRYRESDREGGSVTRPARSAAGRGSVLTARRFAREMFSMLEKQGLWRNSIYISLSNQVVINIQEICPLAPVSVQSRVSYSR